MTYLKGYMKAVKTHLQETKPDRVPAFEKGAAAFAKKCVFASLRGLESLVLTKLCTQGPRLVQRLAVLHWRVDEPRRHGRCVQIPSLLSLLRLWLTSSRSHSPHELPRGRRHPLHGLRAFPSPISLSQLAADCSPLTQWKDGLKEVKL